MKDMDESTVLPLAEEDLATGDEQPTVGSGHPDDDDNDDDVDSENPLWQLFLLAKNLTVPSSEPSYFDCTFIAVIFSIFSVFSHLWNKCLLCSPCPSVRP
jgi:hypothetical protein